MNPLAIRSVTDEELPPDLSTILTGETIGIEGIGVGIVYLGRLGFDGFAQLPLGLLESRIFGGGQCRTTCHEILGDGIEAVRSTLRLVPNPPAIVPDENETDILIVVPSRLQAVENLRFVSNSADHGIDGRLIGIVGLDGADSGSLVTVFPVQTSEPAIWTWNDNAVTCAH